MRAVSRMSKEIPLLPNESFTSRTSANESKNWRSVRKSPKRWFGILHWTGVGLGSSLRSSHSRSSL